MTGDTAMKLPKSGPASGTDSSGYSYSHRREGCPARDVSWHPHYPVLASTSFDQTVKIWTLQNLKEESGAKQREEEEQNLRGRGHQNLYGDEDDDDEEWGEEDEEDESDIRGSASASEGRPATIQEILRLLMSRGAFQTSEEAPGEDEQEEPEEEEPADTTEKDEESIQVEERALLDNVDGVGSQGTLEADDNDNNKDAVQDESEDPFASSEEKKE